MKKRTYQISIGTVDFSKVEFMDSIELFIDIKDLPNYLMEKVNSAIAEDKLLYEEQNKDYLILHNEKWSKRGVEITPQLHIILPEDKKIKYELFVFYQDLEEEDLCNSVSMEIDLAGYEKQLKKIVMFALMEKFF